MVDKNHVRFQDAVIELPKNNSKKKVVLGVRSEKIHIDSAVRKENIKGTIEFVNFLGDKWQYIIRLFDGTEVNALKRTPSDLRSGDKVSINFFSDNIFIFDEPKDFEKEKAV